MEDEALGRYWTKEDADPGKIWIVLFHVEGDPLAPAYGRDDTPLVIKEKCGAEF